MHSANHRLGVLLCFSRRILRDMRVQSLNWQTLLGSCLEFCKNRQPTSRWPTLGLSLGKRTAKLASAESDIHGIATGITSTKE